VSLDPTTDWSPTNGKIYQRPDGKQCLVIPLFSQIQDEGLLGTGLCVDTIGDLVEG
jgi:hypothetical protein